MASINEIVLYVNDPEQSAKFYAQLMPTTNIEHVPDFSFIVLHSGLMIGFQQKSTEPAAQPQFSGFELVINEESNQAVNKKFQAWQSQGINFVQQPCQLIFGYTFVALDQDDHRIRVLCPIKNKQAK